MTMSYETIKAILSASSFEKRDLLHVTLPSLRTANQNSPYQLDTVVLSDTYLGMKDRSWSIETDKDGDNEVFTYVRYEEDGYNFCHRIEKSVEEAMEMLIKEYLKPYTFIKTLKIWNCPSNFPSKILKLNVKEFHLEHDKYEMFEKVKPILNGELEKVKCRVNPRTWKVMDDPIVKNARFLELQFPYFENRDISVDQLASLRNPDVYIIHIGIEIHKIFELVMNWQSTRRPLGTKLKLAIEDYLYVLDVMEYTHPRVADSFYSKIVALEESFFSNSLTIPIDEKSELVVFGGEKVDNWRPFNWTFRMEVMEKGATRRKLG